MKNTQLHKRIKKKNRKVSIEEQVKLAYSQLPKWAKEVLDADKEIAIKSITHTIKNKYNINPDTKKRQSARQIFISSARSIARNLGIGTKKDIYTKFRNMEPAIYAKFNSYMYRNGFSASQYFYDNVKFKKDKNYITATLILPKAKSGRLSYSELEINYNYSPKINEEELSAFMYI